MGWHRFSGTPELPTILESGVTEYDMALWQGVFVPAGTPKDVMSTLTAGVLKVLDTPEMKDRFIKAGVQIAPLNQTRFSDLYFSDITRWKRVMEKSNIKLD